MTWIGHISAWALCSLLVFGCGASTSEAPQEAQSDTIEADTSEPRGAVSDVDEDDDVSPETKEDVLTGDDVDTSHTREASDVSPPGEFEPRDDVSISDAVGDSGAREVQDTLVEDAGLEDISSVADASMEEVMVSDTSQGSDSEDTQGEIVQGEGGDAQDDAQEASDDAGESDAQAGPTCDPEGTWVLETTTAALPGQGCQPDGSPAQGPNTKTFIVTQNPDGSLVGVVPELSEPIPEVSVTKLEGLPCSFEFILAVSIYFPSLGGEEPSTVYLTYTYTVDLADGGVHGSGTVHSATIFESGETQTECTEAITVGGGFTPLGG